MRALTGEKMFDSFTFNGHPAAVDMGMGIGEMNKCQPNDAVVQRSTKRLVG